MVYILYGIYVYIFIYVPGNIGKHIFYAKSKEKMLFFDVSHIMCFPERHGKTAYTSKPYYYIYFKG